MLYINIQYFVFYINQETKLKTYMQQVERVKKIALKDNKNRQEQYILSQNILGKGKYGKVYKAVHVDNPDKVFAVKVIEFSSQKAKDQYLKQLEIIRHLPRSLNLVKIHSQHLQSKNNFYLFEEYCDGGSLYEQKLNRKGAPFTEQQAYNLFFQVVRGFIDLRKANIFHEDIKPQNILIKNNLYKLTDFGISQLEQKIEVSQIRKGTLVYMPPQKLKGSTFIPTSKSQIFSIGITLYQVIFGYHPYLNKRPANYKQYLKLIHEAQLKSPQQLKNVFPTRSLCIDKFIRTILRMIQLGEAKRLSFQQLKDYVTNTQPFKTMEISEIEPIAKKKSDKPMRYEEVARSNIIVKSQNGMGQLLICKQNKKKAKQEYSVIIDTFKTSLQLYRDVSSFIQQGLFYSKNSNIFQLKKIETNSRIQLNKVPKLIQIQFISLLLMQKIFSQLEKIFSNFVFNSEIQMDQQKKQDKLLSGIQQDVQFISNQFLKFYSDIEVENKKQVRTKLKQKNEQLTTLLIQILKQIFQNISSVRINFRQDILTVLFLKFAPPVLKFIADISKCVGQGENKKVLQLLATQQYISLKKILLQFSSAESDKKPKLRKTFENQMRDYQLLEDDQSNSDQFEVLDIDDLY